MKLICLSVPKPGASLEKYQPYLQKETRYGWQLYKSGLIRDIYFRHDQPGVVLIVEADSAEAARNELDGFPLAKAGLISWDVIPVGPFANWELLFAKD